MSSAPQIVTLVATVETSLESLPFTGHNQIQANATAAATLRGVNHPGINILRQGFGLHDGDPATVGIGSEVSDTVRYIKAQVLPTVFTQSGTDITINSNKFPALLNANFAVLSEANRLEVVARTVGLNSTDVLGTLKRVTAAADPAAGEFKVSEAGGVVTVTVGEVDLVADPVGYSLEIWLADPEDIYSLAIADILPVEAISHDVMTATGANIALSGIPHV